MEYKHTAKEARAAIEAGKQAQHDGCVNEWLELDLGNISLCQWTSGRVSPVWRLDDVESSVDLWAIRERPPVSINDSVSDALAELCRTNRRVAALHTLSPDLVLLIATLGANAALRNVSGV